MERLIVFSEEVLVFDSKGVLVLLKSEALISVDLGFNVLEFSDKEFGLVRASDNKFLRDKFCSFIGPSSISQLAKRSAIELKLKNKTVKGIKFKSNFYVEKYSFYVLFIDSMVNVYKVVLSFFHLTFRVSFTHITSFGWDFRSLEISVKYSDKYFFKVVYSRLVICFKYLFVNSSSLERLFPNHLVEDSFNSISEFDQFIHYNALSFKRFRVIVFRVLRIYSKLVTRGVFGSQMGKLEHRAILKFREGVKSEVNKFYSPNGVVSRCYTRSVFVECDFYSCYSESYYYNILQYTKVLSFNTGGRMSKSCKTFKQGKLLATSSVFKSDRYWTRSSCKKNKKN